MYMYECMYVYIQKCYFPLFRLYVGEYIFIFLFRDRSFLRSPMKPYCFTRARFASKKKKNIVTRKSLIWNTSHHLSVNKRTMEKSCILLLPLTLLILNPDPGPSPLTPERGFYEQHKWRRTMVTVCRKGGESCIIDIF